MNSDNCLGDESLDLYVSDSGTDLKMVPQGAAGAKGFAERFVSSDGKAIRVPNLTLAEFCEKYGLNDTIRQVLEKEGFETAGALLETTEPTLKEAGLKIGQIGELRRALRVFLSAEHVEAAP
ncbi:hypothetical protein DFH07DRAFT_1063424 [Mycena maculata]|uniref:SAM domain-containing protein n=1 Tax=Mycena maculata TaxID=230809 RepID=A0AAD7N3P7_9AGAR|nr:hypothetical protein DFH07DRAFT_1063424 [Mycena maculata]